MTNQKILGLCLFLGVPPILISKNSRLDIGHSRWASPAVCFCAAALLTIPVSVARADEAGLFARIRQSLHQAALQGDWLPPDEPECDDPGILPAEETGLFARLAKSLHQAALHDIGISLPQPTVLSLPLLRHAETLGALPPQDGVAIAAHALHNAGSQGDPALLPRPGAVALPPLRHAETQGILPPQDGAVIAAHALHGAGSQGDVSLLPHPGVVAQPSLLHAELQGLVPPTDSAAILAHALRRAEQQGAASLLPRPDIVALPPLHFAESQDAVSPMDSIAIAAYALYRAELHGAVSPLMRLDADPLPFAPEKGMASVPFSTQPFPLASMAQPVLPLTSMSQPVLPPAAAPRALEGFPTIGLPNTGGPSPWGFSPTLLPTVGVTREFAESLQARMAYDGIMDSSLNPRNPELRPHLAHLLGSPGRLDPDAVFALILSGCAGSTESARIELAQKWAREYEDGRFSGIIDLHATRYYFFLGNYPETIRRAGLVSEQHPDLTVKAMLLRVLAEAHTGKIKEAAGIIRDIAQKYPDSPDLPEIRYMEAWLALQDWQTEDAKNVLMSIIRDYPRTPTAAKAEKMLTALLETTQ